MMVRYRMMDTRHMTTTATFRVSDQARELPDPSGHSPQSSSIAAPSSTPGCVPRVSSRRLLGGSRDGLGRGGGLGGCRSFRIRGWNQGTSVRCSWSQVLENRPSCRPPRPAPASSQNWELLTSGKGSVPVLGLLPPMLGGCPRPASVGNLLPAPCLAHTQLLPPDPLQGCEFGLLPGAQAFLGTAGSCEPEGARGQKLPSCSSGEKGMLGRASGPHHHGDHHGPGQHAEHAAPAGEVGLVLASDGVRGCRGGRVGKLGPWPLLEGSQCLAAAAQGEGEGGHGLGDDPPRCPRSPSSPSGRPAWHSSASSTPTAARPIAPRTS